MNIQDILHNENKNKLFIFGLIVLLVVVGTIFFLIRTPGIPQDNNDQLLSDIALLAPRDSASQTNDRLNTLPIIALSADTTAVSPGKPIVISWASPNAEECTDGDGNPLLTTGSLSVTPIDTYTMDVVCTNTKGTTIESITVMATTAPIIALSAYPSSVKAGEQSFISWNTLNSTRCVDGAGKALRLNDSFSVSPRTAYTFKINCIGLNGESKNSITISIAPPSIKTPTKTTATVTTAGSSILTSKTTTVATKTTTGGPNIEISASKLNVSYGETSTVSWKISGATNCSAITTTGATITNKLSGESAILSLGQRVPTPPGTLPLIGDIEVGVLDGKTTATIIIQCTDSSGKKTERSITVTSAPKTKNDCLNYGRDRDGKPSISPFGANPSSVPVAGNYSDITWNVTCATMCEAKIDPWGKIIETIDASSIRDYVEGTDYNRYHAISNGGEPVPVTTNGGVRVYPGGPDELRPDITSNDNSIWGVFITKLQPTTSTVTLKCTNNDAVGGPRSRTASVSVSVVPPSGGGCGGWVSCTFGW